MMTITNTYHGTEARTRYGREDLDRIANCPPSEWTQAERSLVRRLHDRLCGSADCTCGNVWGERN